MCVGFQEKKPEHILQSSKTEDKGGPNFDHGCEVMWNNEQNGQEEEYLYGDERDTTTFLTRNIYFHFHAFVCRKADERVFMKNAPKSRVGK